MTAPGDREAAHAGGGNRNGHRAALPALGKVLDFMRLIWEVDHSLQRRSKRMGATLGVTGPQRLVIRIVGRAPGSPAGHVARLLHVQPSTLTGILGRLERHGAIRRGADPHDSRRFPLRLTEKGRRLDAHVGGTVEAAIRRVLERTPARDLRATRRVLASIVENMAIDDAVRAPLGNRVRRPRQARRPSLRRRSPRARWSRARSARSS